MIKIYVHVYKPIMFQVIDTKSEPEFFVMKLEKVMKDRIKKSE